MTFAKRILVLLAAFLAIVAVENWLEPILPYRKYLAGVIEIALLALAFLGDRYAQKRLSNTLLVSCDPDAYVKKLRRIMNGVFEKARPTLANVRRLDVCTGLYAAGRFDEMEAELQKITVFPEKTAAVYRFYYLQQHFYNHLRRDETQYAADLFESMRAKPHIYKFKPRVADGINSALTRMRYALRIAQGNYEGAEAYFLHAMRTADNPYGRVFSQLNLGRVYRHAGDMDKAIIAYRYVISHGNKLYAVNLATEALDALVVP